MLLWTVSQGYHLEFQVSCDDDDLFSQAENPKIVQMVAKEAQKGQSAFQTEF